MSRFLHFLPFYLILNRYKSAVKIIISKMIERASLFFLPFFSNFVKIYRLQDCVSLLPSIQVLLEGRSQYVQKFKVVLGGNTTSIPLSLND